MEFVMNIILSSVRMATPLIFLALTELYSQRAGLVHIGLEGLASIGSLVGFLVSLITGSPMLGVLAGAAVVMAYTKPPMPANAPEMVTPA